MHVFASGFYWRILRPGVLLTGFAGAQFYPRTVNEVMHERQWVPGRLRMQWQEARAVALSEEDATIIEERLRDMGMW